MRYLILALGLLVTPAVAEVPDAEAIKLQKLGYKAQSDIQKQFESQHMKVPVVEVIWACSFKDVECRASNKLKFESHAIVVPPRGQPQLAVCKVTANQEMTDIVSSCRLVAPNLKFDRTECAEVKEYFKLCAEKVDWFNGEPPMCGYPDSSYKFSLLDIEMRHRLPYSRTTVEGASNTLCMKVCHEEMTAEQALHKFCPRYRLKP